MDPEKTVVMVMMTLCVLAMLCFGASNMLMHRDLERSEAENRAMREQIDRHQELHQKRRENRSGERRAAPPRSDAEVAPSSDVEAGTGTAEPKLSFWIGNLYCEWRSDG